jgi:hypothetical protein
MPPIFRRQIRKFTGDTAGDGTTNATVLARAIKNTKNKGRGNNDAPHPSLCAAPLAIIAPRHCRMTMPLFAYFIRGGLVLPALLLVLNCMLEAVKPEAGRAAAAIEAPAVEAQSTSRVRAVDWRGPMLQFKDRKGARP